MFLIQVYYYLWPKLKDSLQSKINQPMLTTKHIFLYVSFLCLSLSSCSQSSSPMAKTKVQFIPGSNQSAPTVINYSTSNGKMDMFYLREGNWTKYEVFPSPSLSIKGPVNLEYIAGSPGALPSLFASNGAGEFEFFYLQDNQWLKNELLPAGKVSLNAKKVMVEFTPAMGGRTAFVSAYSPNGKEFAFYEMNEGKWTKNTTIDQTLD